MILHSSYMKKTLKPHEDEMSIYYSDFSGKLLDHNFPPPVKVKLEFNYGSEYDGFKMKLHLDDEDSKKLLNFIKENLTEESKQEIFYGKFE